MRPHDLKYEVLLHTKEYSIETVRFVFHVNMFSFHLINTLFFLGEGRVFISSL